MHLWWNSCECTNNAVRSLMVKIRVRGIGSWNFEVSGTALNYENSDAGSYGTGPRLWKLGLQCFQFQNSDSEVSGCDPSFWTLEFRSFWNRSECRSKQAVALKHWPLNPSYTEAGPVRTKKQLQRKWNPTHLIDRASSVCGQLHRYTYIIVHGNKSTCLVWSGGISTAENVYGSMKSLLQDSTVL